MLNSCNIGNNDRIVRIVLGAILLIGAIADLGRGFLLTMAIIMMVEGIIGWCGIPLLIEKFNLQNIFKKDPL